MIHNKLRIGAIMSDEAYLCYPVNNQKLLWCVHGWWCVNHNEIQEYWKHFALLLSFAISKIQQQTTTTKQQQQIIPPAGDNGMVWYRGTMYH